MYLECYPLVRFLFFFFNDTATTEIYTLSLHDALPISARVEVTSVRDDKPICTLETTVRNADGEVCLSGTATTYTVPRLEEHTSELQSRQYLVCRLLLEKKKKKQITLMYQTNMNISSK